jgi:hydroxymethylglutaryl-CoA reductase (NADPH)
MLLLSLHIHPTMLAAWLFPSARRGNDSSKPHSPGFFDHTLTPVLLSLSKRACIHPVYTIVTVAVLASTTYLGLIESSLFERRITVNNAIGRVDINYLLAGSKKLYTGPETSWKWNPDQNWAAVSPVEVCSPQLNSRICSTANCSVNRMWRW